MQKCAFLWRDCLCCWKNDTFCVNWVVNFGCGETPRRQHFCSNIHVCPTIQDAAKQRWQIGQTELGIDNSNLFNFHHLCQHDYGQLCPCQTKYKKSLSKYGNGKQRKIANEVIRILRRKVCEGNIRETKCVLEWSYVWPIVS